MPYYLAAIYLAIAGCGSRAPDPPKAKYLALGDSYTCGESVDPPMRWPVQLAEQLKKDGIDLGEPQLIATTGWTTDELSAGMDDAKLDPPYELVTLLIGVNNQYRGRDAEQYRGEFVGLMKRAVELAGGKASHVVVLSIPDWGVTPFAEGQNRGQIGAAIDRFNQMNREETIRAGAGYVDITAESRLATTRPTLVADDGLHPSGEMYGEWVKIAVPVVKEALDGK